MHNLTYKRTILEEDTDIPQLIAVYQMPEISQYLSISDNYFCHVTTNENVYYYKIYENSQLIGSTPLETQGTVLFMDILVFLEFQRTGLGTKIVKDIQNDVFGLAYERIEISIEERNATSLSLFEKQGLSAHQKKMS